MSPVELRASKIRNGLVAGLAVAGLLACLALAASARPLWVFPGWLLLWAGLQQLREDPAADLVLTCVDDAWQLQRGELRWRAQLLPGTVRLPQVMRLCFQLESRGSTISLLLFDDSADVQALRRLRRRLALCGAVA